MELSRHTTFRFTLKPNQAQREALSRHVGASRFAFNQCLRFVIDGLEARKADPEVEVPWSGFDLINAFNRWKRSEAAGVDDAGRPGLPWRAEVLQHVFEEAAVDLGRALSSFSSGRKEGRRVGFPRFKKKSAPRQSFRIRSKRGSKGRASVRLGDEAPRTVTLPKLGSLRVIEDTRKLRRMIDKGRARILFATVSRRNGRWTLSVNVEATPRHDALRHSESRPDESPVGIDRGLKTFAVLADADGHEIDRIESPRPLRAALPKLRRASRSLSRKKKGSRNRERQRRKLSRTHERIRNLRRDFTHRTSSRLAKTHRHLVLEDLCTRGLMRTRMARSLADSAWAQFGSMLEYKVAWYGGALSTAHRFYPSTRRCSACGQVGERLPLSQRTFHCTFCGHEADRDTNAATCLAQWPHVAAKHAETQNACGEASAGERGNTHSWNWPQRSRKSFGSTPEEGGVDTSVPGLAPARLRGETVDTL